MNVNIIRLDTVNSTNRYLSDYKQVTNDDITVATALLQTAGQGMGTNVWESEKGQNLLFSILVRPVMLSVNRQFLLSMAHAIALKETLDTYINDVTIKWPNDIYWRDKKISGTRIDTSLSSNGIKNAVIGTGINVNQQTFHSNAPNPVSLYQILGHNVSIDDILDKAMQSFTKHYTMITNGDYNDIVTMYHNGLYRSHGFHLYKDKQGEFEATIVEVEDDGHLVLRDHTGMIRSYAFKEIEFKI